MRPTVIFSVLLLFITVLAATTAPAAELLVPGLYPTIQLAINDAHPGDEVVVEDGVYSGLDNRNLDFLGKAITVRSQNNSPADCIIDCGGGVGKIRAFHFHNGEGHNSVVSGFTIRNGHAMGGGGILCEPGASPTITGCVFENNEALGSTNGGAVCANAGLVLNECTFTGNSAGGGGGAVYCETGSPWITSCTFTGNSATYGGAINIRSTFEAQISENRVTASNSVRGGGIYLSLTEGDSISGNLIADNRSDWGAGLYLEQCEQLKIYGNVIIDNQALLYGGGIHAREWCTADLHQNTIVNNTAGQFIGSGGGINAGWRTTLTITNTILWGNSSPSGQAIAAVEQPGNSIMIDCSDIDGGRDACVTGSGSTLDWGSENIDSDPLFCNAGEDDYSLDEHSSCTAEEQPVCGRIGARDTGCAGQVISVSLTCVPDTGTLVFQTMLSLELTNLTVSQTRKIAGRLDVIRADGSVLTYWRHGWVNLPAGTSYARSWPLLLPPRQSMVGQNRFVLIGEDVTPVPYNQPPYWPAGETDSSDCIITASMP